MIAPELGLELLGVVLGIPVKVLLPGLVIELVLIHPFLNAIGGEVEGYVLFAVEVVLYLVPRLEADSELDAVGDVGRGDLILDGDLHRRRPLQLTVAVESVDGYGVLTVGVEALTVLVADAGVPQEGQAREGIGRELAVGFPARLRDLPGVRAVLGVRLVGYDLDDAAHHRPGFRRHYGYLAPLGDGAARQECEADCDQNQGL